MSNLCIYHGGCADGFGSAWVVHHYYKQALQQCEFHAGVYSDAPPDVTGKTVYIVDFSYKRDIILKMLETAKKLVIIDHHASAIEDLKGLEHPKLEKVFSTMNSGCVLTWDYFIPFDRVPKTLRHIEDRDLWRFDLDGTKEIVAALYSYEFEFDLWTELMEDWTKLLKEGHAILRAHDKLVKSALSKVPRYMKIDYCYDVPVMNVGHNLASDVGNELAKQRAFAATYYDTNEHRVFSLRSSPEGMDVSKIASRYGGGGHCHAAGFRVSFDKLSELGLQ